MRSRVLINRYARGFLRALDGEEEFFRLYKELQEFEKFIFSRKKYEHIFSRPFVPASQKVKLIKEILKKSGFNAKVARFIILLVENERMSILPGLVKALPDLWNESRGVVSFEVASVIPLTKEQKQALQKKLEKMESAPVVLKFRTAPDLIGGISLNKDNIIYDLSIRGNLNRMKEKISEG